VLAGAVGVLIFFIFGIAGYHRWWDPARADGQRVWEFVLADADETQCIRVSGEPGGQQLVLDPAALRGLAPICGGVTHFFECRARARDATSWLRLVGSPYWLPEAVLRPRTGMSSRGLPNC
jgi:hypothetical protein